MGREQAHEVLTRTLISRGRGSTSRNPFSFLPAYVSPAWASVYVCVEFAFPTLVEATWESEKFILVCADLLLFRLANAASGPQHFCQRPLFEHHSAAWHHARTLPSPSGAHRPGHGPGEPALHSSYPHRQKCTAAFSLYLPGSHGVVISADPWSCVLTLSQLDSEKPRISYRSRSLPHVRRCKGYFLAFYNSLFIVL